jgi:DNA-binding Xre family transcriptional regulator
MSKGAVTDAVQRAMGQGLAWPLPAQLDEAGLEALMYRKPALPDRYAVNLQPSGHPIAEWRRAKGLTLTQLAAQAAVGRSTLAALEAGKLPELGLERVARLCAAVDLVLEADH